MSKRGTDSASANPVDTICPDCRFRIPPATYLDHGRLYSWCAACRRNVVPIRVERKGQAQ